MSLGLLVNRFEMGSCIAKQPLWHSFMECKVAEVFWSPNTCCFSEDKERERLRKRFGGRRLVVIGPCSQWEWLWRQGGVVMRIVGEQWPTKEKGWRQVSIEVWSEVETTAALWSCSGAKPLLSLVMRQDPELEHGHLPLFRFNFLSYVRTLIRHCQFATRGLITDVNWTRGSQA